MSDPSSTPGLTQRDHWFALILAGPSGTGKTTVGRTLSRELSIPLLDADDYHSRRAVERMAAGTPLNDHYRDAWVERVIGGMITYRRMQEKVIVA